MSAPVMESLDTAVRTQRAFSFFGVTSFRELSHAYRDFDKKLYAEGQWDPRKEDYAINRVKAELVEIDPAELSYICQDWRKDILWLWYRRAMTHTLWLHSGMSVEERSVLAHRYIRELKLMQWFTEPLYQEGKTGLAQNCYYEQCEQAKLAEIWLFLVNDDLEEVGAWTETLMKREHRFIAEDVLNDYRRLRLQMQTDRIESFPSRTEVYRTLFELYFLKPLVAV